MEMQNQSEANAGAQPANDEALSESDLIAELTAPEVEDEQETQEESEEETEDESNEETDQEASETEEEEESEESEEDESATLTADKLFQMMEGMDAEEIKKLGRKTGNKAISRFGELTARAKAAEDQLRNSPAQSSPPKEKVTSPLLDGVKTLEELEAKASELKRLRKNTTAILLDHEDYGPNDEIDVGGKSLTKKSLRKLELDLAEALEDAVPYMRQEFDRKAMIGNEVAVVEKRILSEVPDLRDEKSDVAKNFKGITESKLFANIYEQFPEAKPVLTLLAAHGTKSLFSKAKAAAPTTAVTKPKAKPPGSPSGVATVQPKPSGKGKEAEGKMKRFEETGSQEDLIAAMASES